ncbi:MAG: PEP-CTERM sorting domain-containing protein [Cyanobacteria bacterium J06642_11]
MQFNLSVPSICATLVASIAGFASPASAIQINFDDQGLVGPSDFVLAGDAQILDIETEAGNVRFEGGVIISEATNDFFNDTSTYSTANGFLALPENNPTRQNPLTITFENPIENFFLDVINGLYLPGLEYTVADNLGNASTFALDSLQSGGSQTVGFATTGTVVTVTADTSQTFGTYNFAIDNINFNAPLSGEIIDPVLEVIVPTPEQSAPTSVPEPASVVALLLVGALGVYQQKRQPV